MALLYNSHSKKPLRPGEFSLVEKPKPQARPEDILSAMMNSFGR